MAEDKGCEEVMGFATSAVRDATNSDDVLGHVKDASGVDIQVLPGEDEARLTFLAVRPVSYTHLTLPTICSV